MRSLMIVLALAGCYRDSTPAAPSNKAAAPDYSATANDELGFLPVDAEVVLGIDMVSARRSALWQKFEPRIIEALGPELEKARSECGFDPVQAIERFTIALKAVDGDRFKGVFVVRGGNSSQLLDCMSKQAAREGSAVTKDRGVLVFTKASRKNLVVAAAAAAPSTLVFQADSVANHDTITPVLASGTPLRTSQTFMALFGKREPNAAMWGMANGNAKMFDELAAMGARPRSIDGTVTVTDRFTIAVRLTMPSAGDADRVRVEIDKAKAMAGNFVERIDTAVKGDVLQIVVVITEDQLRSLIGMMGGAIGP